MDLRLLHPGHPLRLRTEISRVRKIAEGSHQVMRLVWWNGVQYTATSNTVFWF